jgi:BirA family biotin operon repressor/biotin-[acetyl-CoA-carboxylase] ligase
MSTEISQRLLEQLADGEFHSGPRLRAALGLSRSAVHKHLRALADLGLEVHAVPGTGYRLPVGMELLAPERILDAMEPSTRQQLADLQVHLHIDSTNSQVRRQAAAHGPGQAGGHACLAESQHAGRGRRGRFWVSPPGGNIYLSLLWPFDTDPSALGSLGLAIGVAGLRALREAGVEGCGIKWPNDLLHGGRKLAGILLELNGRSAGPSTVIVGLGLNAAMPRSGAEGIDQPWVDLAGILGAPPPRNRLAGRLLHHLIAALQSYREHGLGAFLEEYRRHDLLLGKDVTVKAPRQETGGIACGIDARGALQLLVEGEQQSVEFGEVSVRST